MNIKYDKTQNAPLRIVLAKPGEKKVCFLNSVDPYSVNLELNLKDVDTLSFTINQYVFDSYTMKEMPANGYDAVDISMELYLEDFGWFKITDPVTVTNDGYNETKTVNAESIEVELQTKNITGLKVNRGTVDSLEMLIADNLYDYGDGLVLPIRQIILYDSIYPEYSLLDILLEGTGWSVGYVDEHLIYKDDGTNYVIGSFEVDSSNLYSVLVNDISQSYECVFIFDTQNFTVNAYSLNYENNINRTVFKDSNIIIGFRGVQDNLDISSDRDVYTVYNVQGGDELGIIYANFGENRIENIDYFLTTKYMSQELIDKYNYWRDYRESQRDAYMEITKLYNDQLGVVSEFEDRVPNSGVQTDWSEMDDDTILEYYSIYTALKAGYEAIYVDANGNFDIEALRDSPDWLDYYSAVTYTIPALENEIALRGLESSIEGGQVDYDYDAWETDWDLYGISELRIKIEDYNERIATLAETGYDLDWEEFTEENPGITQMYYEEIHGLYLQYAAERDAAQVALDQRINERDAANDILEEYGATRTEIVNSVQKENERFGFTDDDLAVLWKLYNEVDYTNENIFITSLDDLVTTVDVEYELYQEAVLDLEKYAQPQYSYNSTLGNLLSYYDYRMFHKDFNCGNYIRVMTNDSHVVKLRIVSIVFNPMTWENDLSIEYSNMIRTRSEWTDKTDLLDISGNTGSNSVTSTSSGTYSSIGELEQMIIALLNSTQLDNYSQNLTNEILAAVSTAVNATITPESLAEVLTQLPNGITTEMIANKAVTGDKIDWDTVGEYGGTVTTSMIADKAVTSPKIDWSSIVSQITATMIVDSAITSAKINWNSIQSQITASMIADNTITKDKIDWNSINNIQSGSITVTTFEDDAVGFDVEFDTEFSSIPVVTLTPMHPTSAASVSVILRTVSTTGFAGELYCSAGNQDWTVSWIAICE